MKKNLRFVFLVLAFAAFTSLVYSAQDSANLQAAPVFQLTDLNGKAVFLGDYKDKQAVILLFWTTWCPYCREELKALNERVPSLAKDSVGVLAINVGEPKYKVENFMKSRNLTLIVLLDKEGTVADAYDLIGVPSYIVVNQSGQIVSTENRFPKEALKELMGK